DVLVQQRPEFDHLQLQMAAMLKRQEQIGSQFETFEEDAPPPHY
ncbi:SlyX family protein, partial [Pseudomonas syringae group genomosp. 7]